MLLLALLLTLAGAPPPARPTTVLVLPIEAREGASRDLCEQLTTVFVAEAARSGAYSILSFREVESTMTQEQVRQVSGCSSASCAAEIAGALDRDQIIIGSLGVVGDVYLLSLSRIQSRDAQILRRAVRRVRRGEESELLDETAGAARELMRNARAPAPEAAEVAHKTAPPVGKQSPVTPAPLALRVGSGALGTVGAVLLLAASAGAAVAGAVLVADIAGGDWSNLFQRRHGVTLRVAGLGDGAAVTSVALLLAGAVVLAGAVALAASSLVQ